MHTHGNEGGEMRDKDLRRVGQHLKAHLAINQREPMKGYKLPWSYIKFAAWAIPLLIEHGDIFVDEPIPVPGGAACNRSDPA